MKNRGKGDQKESMKLRRKGGGQRECMENRSERREKKIMEIKRRGKEK